VIYTVGHKESYDRYFQELSRPFKAGGNIENGEPGGSVWETEEEARKYCNEGCQVYGVLANWDQDTVQSKDGDWHDLLIDAELIILDNIRV
jgi:hypothetical protein